MKIIQFFTFPMMCCCLLGISVAKAQPAPPPSTCIQQCQAFCTALIANFSVGKGDGPLNDSSFVNFFEALPYPGSEQTYEIVKYLLEAKQMMEVRMNQDPPNFLASLLSNCQSPTYLFSRV